MPEVAYTLSKGIGIRSLISNYSDRVLYFIHIQCEGEGGGGNGYGVLGLRQMNTCRKVALQVNYSR